jgi:hypothetical protein
MNASAVMALIVIRQLPAANPALTPNKHRYFTKSVCSWAARKETLGRSQWLAAASGIKTSRVPPLRIAAAVIPL